MYVYMFKSIMNVSDWTASGDSKRRRKWPQSKFRLCFSICSLRNYKS